MKIFDKIPSPKFGFGRDVLLNGEYGNGPTQICTNFQEKLYYQWVPGQVLTKIIHSEWIWGNFAYIWGNFEKMNPFIYQFSAFYKGSWVKPILLTMFEAHSDLCAMYSPLTETPSFQDMISGGAYLQGFVFALFVCSSYF